jgi:sulfate adenylyltransferase
MSRRGATILLTGLPGAGKSTLAGALAAHIQAAGRPVTLLDGDEVRRELSAGLGMSEEDRTRHVMRCAFVAAQIARHGGLSICALIAPMHAMRAAMRARCAEHGDFVLVHVATPLEVCEARDPKGLYARARAGLLPQMTGVDAPYERPLDAEITVEGVGPLDHTFEALWAALVPWSLVPRGLP